MHNIAFRAVSCGDTIYHLLLLKIFLNLSFKHKYFQRNLYARSNGSASCKLCCSGCDVRVSLKTSVADRDLVRAHVSTVEFKLTFVMAEHGSMQAGNFQLSCSEPSTNIEH